MLAALVNSILIKAGMSIDRVLFLRLPNPRHSLPWLSVRVITAAAAILALLLATPQLLVWRYVDSPSPIIGG